MLASRVNLPWSWWFKFRLLELGVKSTIGPTGDCGLWFEVFKGRWNGRVLKVFGVVRASNDLQIELLHLVAREFLAILRDVSDLRDF
jgi:hypothetical protein